MATRIYFGTSGIVGVTEFVAAQVTEDTIAAGGSAYAVTDRQPTIGDITITLPAADATTGAPRSGDVIYIKNLMESMVPATQTMPSRRPVITVDRNGHNIDGGTNNVTSMVELESFILIYVNQAIGWMVISIS